MNLNDINFDEVKDLIAVDEGEHKIRITDAKVGYGKDSGNPYFMVTFDVPEVRNSRDFNYLVIIPQDGWEQKKIDSKIRAFKAFCKAFSADIGQTWGEIIRLVEAHETGTLDDLFGLEGWAILGTEEDDYGVKNRIKRFM